MISRYTLSFFILISLFFSSIQQNSLTEAKDYKNLNGTQIYMNENTNYFAYISINNDTSKLNATIYLYTKTDITTASEGIYIAIGFGTTEMPNSDIILCAALKDKTGWCKDYNGVHDDIVLKTSITSNVVFAFDNAPAGFSPFIYRASWSFTRTNTNVSKIIDGTTPAIWAYGSISGGVPIEHPKNNYGSIKTGDGNLGAGAGSTGGNSFYNKIYFSFLAFLSLILI